ncbi:hypothetical protein [Devosia lacusdianchii]|uniref:hypothetical protein n=1 Tax=Devosia lacusdianchii TaxID=2917991 RepID=UPI001F05A330|nr:hypothetical protein [Devosia sp. JXJ CY 41]
MTRDHRTSTCGCEKGAEHLECGGLTGAIGTEKTNYFTGTHGQIDAAHCLDGFTFCLVCPFETLCLDHGFARFEIEPTDIDPIEIL